MAKPPRGLAKPKPSVNDLDRVLVVCEGKKTEPLYFLGFRECFELNTLSVEGTGNDASALVDRAIKLSRRETAYGEQYDAVWCVFDHDDQPHFDGASQKAKANGLRLARSWPCFEYWLLLHFEYTRKPYAGTHHQSSCAACIKDLRKHLRKYEKSDEGLFAMTHSRLCGAVDNAKQARKDAKDTGATSPSTEVHELVAELLALAAKRAELGHGGDISSG